MYQLRITSLIVVLLVILPIATIAFQPAIQPTSIPQTTSIISSRRHRLSLQKDNNNNEDDINSNSIQHSPIISTVTAASLALTLSLTPILTSNPQIVNAYEESDYASETVTNVVSQLKSTAGDVDGTFTTLEDIAKIITEGKGVGGTLTYDGVKLNEGQNVADEDTTIYNPGLTLLTSSEKERLVSAIIDNRKVGLSTSHWSENNEFAFDFLKQKLDPLHMYELEGYLGILPFYGAALYLVALFVQKNARGIFPL